jgi:hypothetical protein
MQESSIDRFVVPVPGSRDVMTEILRAEAQKVLGEMIQAEVEDWCAGPVIFRVAPVPL